MKDTLHDTKLQCVFMMMMLLLLFYSSINVKTSWTWSIC